MKILNNLKKYTQQIFNHLCFLKCCFYVDDLFLLTNAMNNTEGLFIESWSASAGYRQRC